MRKIIYQFNFISFFFWLLIISFSCNDAKETGKTESTSDSDSNSKKTVVAEAPAAALIGGTLDTLWLASTDFPSVPEKIVFSFTIDANDKLKMHGWRVKAGPKEFDDLPNYKLINAGQHKTGTYGPDIYFGNIILKQADVNAIRIKINQGGYTKVLFVPKIHDNHIYYDIFVGKDDAKIRVLAVDPTGIEANPSPPKNY